MNRKNKSDNQINTNEAVKMKDFEVTVGLGRQGRPRPNLGWPDSSDSVGMDLGNLERSGSE